MKRVLLTFFIFYLISSFAYAGQTEDKIADAVNLYNTGSYEECIKNLNTIITQDSSYPVAYYYLGLSYAKVNNKKQAIKNYEKVIASNADKSLKSMAKAAKDCLGTSGFTALDAQLSISKNSQAENFVSPEIKKEDIKENSVSEDVKKESSKLSKSSEKSLNKMPTNDEIVSAIMILKRAGLWNGTSVANNSQVNNIDEKTRQQNEMAKMYMQQMSQQMNNPMTLMMGMNGGNNNTNNNNMMNMLPYMMNNQGNGNNNPAVNQQFLQTMMMSQMMPNFDFSSSDNNR